MNTPLQPDQPKFWETKTLEEMSKPEWESLCDGCGRCCLIKLEDEESGKVFTSDVRCRLLDGTSCRCTNYPNRKQIVADCIILDVKAVKSLSWIPSTCAYRRIAEGRGLAWWHPLVSGDPNTVVQAGISVRDKTVAEADVKPGTWEDHIADWLDFDPDE